MVGEGNIKEGALEGPSMTTSLMVTMTSRELGHQIDGALEEPGSLAGVLDAAYNGLAWLEMVRTFLILPKCLRTAPTTVWKEQEVTTRSLEAEEEGEVVAVIYLMEEYRGILCLEEDTKTTPNSQCMVVGTVCLMISTAV